METLLNTLTPPQQKAIRLLRIVLNAYNTQDGVGLFAGISRYSTLTERLKLVATQSRDLPSFWSNLLRKMQWPIPPKRLDSELLTVLHEADPLAVLRVLAMETAYCVMLARHLHDGDKKVRKAGLYEDEPGGDVATLNDNLDEVLP